MAEVVRSPVPPGQAVGLPPGKSAAISRRIVTFGVAAAIAMALKRYGVKAEDLVSNNVGSVQDLQETGTDLLLQVIWPAFMAWAQNDPKRPIWSKLRVWGTMAGGTIAAAVAAYLLGGFG